MEKQNKSSALEAFTKKDLIASFGVFVIAVPLSIGIAMASGASASAGLLSAVIGGLVVGFLAGAPLTVTGPAAGLTLLVFDFVQRFGLGGLAFITLFGGALQILFGILRWGSIFTLVPRPVLNGMLAAIGVIILVSQLHVLVGQAIPNSFVDGLTSLHQSLMATVHDHESWLAPVMICGVLAVLIQVLWDRNPKLKVIPGALPAVFIVTAISLPFVMPRVEIGALFADVPMHLAMFGELASWMSITDFIWPAIALAVVASAESLLTARATDDLAYRRDGKLPECDLNKELMAQGSGNMVAGFLGGIPITSVIVRSAANINFGAKTRWSTVLHGLWIALFVAMVPSLLQAIPLTALAAALVVTGWKLLHLKQVSLMLVQRPREGVLWSTTFFGILLTDLLMGLVAGVVAAILMNIQAVKLYLAQRFGKLSPQLQKSAAKKVA